MVANLTQYSDTQFLQNNNIRRNTLQTSFEVTRNELAHIPAVKSCDTLKSYSFSQIAEAIITALIKLKCQIHSERYVLSLDRMRMETVIVLQSSFDDCLHAVEFCHSVMQDGLLYAVPAYFTIGSANLMTAGKYIPVESKMTNLTEFVSAIQSLLRKVEERYPIMEKRVAMWKQTIVPNKYVKRYIYSACVEDRIVPAHLITRVHDNYFNALGNDESFCEPTLWSLSNAFAEAVKELQPMKQFQIIPKLGNYLDKFSRNPQEMEIIKSGGPR